MNNMKNLVRTTKGTACLLMVFLSSFLFCHAQEIASVEQDYGENLYPVTKQEKRLSELLKWVESTYKINLSYDIELVKNKKVEKGSFPKGNKGNVKEIEAALEETLEPLGLSLRRIEKNYYLIQKNQSGANFKRISGKKNSSSNTSGKGQKSSLNSIQDQTITGVITDENGQPMPGANVKVKDTSIGAASDFDGNYTIKVPSGSTTLVFSYLGYITKEVEINGRSVINCTFSPDESVLDAVVVVGYGTQSRRDLTGSVVSIKGEDAVNIPAPRVEEQLKAKVPGLQILNTGSQPGGTVQIRLRGNNSIEGNNSPLIVIDGMIGGELFFLNPSDIESIEVLKDASATAIYGSRGANGVIIITTKKGKGKVQVNFETFTGWQTVAKTVDVLNAEQYASIQNQIDPSNPIEPQFDTDWQDEVFRDAPLQSYQLSVSGGNEGTSYLFSSSYFNQEGIIDNSDFERLTLRMNLEQKLSDRITIGNNLAYTRTRNNLIKLNQLSGGSSITIQSLLTPALVPTIDPDTGDFAINPFNVNLENPLRTINQRRDLRTNNYLIGNFYGDLELFEGLKYRLNLGYIVRDALQQRYDGRELIASNGGTAQIRDNKTTEILLENTLTYKNTFADKHDLTVLGGFTTQETKREQFFMQGSGFSSDELGFNAIQLAEVIGPIETVPRKSRIVSFLGRLNYSFDGRYLLTASFRADGASVFAENNKWGYFPSASIGWNVANEPFMLDQNVVSDFKLRASYGETGNQSIREYQSLPSFQIGDDYAFGDQVFFNGADPNRVANKDLKWETTTTLNFGLDLSFLDRRIAVTAEYYEKETRDLLYDKELNDYTGFGQQTQNVGKMSNEGMEFSLNANILEGKFKWDTSFNIFFNRNEVVEIGDDFQDELIREYSNRAPSAIREASILREGEPLGAFFGYIFDGIYQNQEEVDAIDDPGAAPGRVKFRDTDGDGDIDDDDRVIIGNPQPDFVWGLTNNFSYQNFDLNFTIQAVQGAEVFWATKYQLLNSANDDNLLTEVLDSWSGEGTSNTTQELGQDPGAMSTRFIEDGSYIRLQNIALGYTLPKPVLDNLKMDQLRFYIGAQNLFLISDYPGYDPEVNSQGGDSTVSNENEFLGFDQGAYPGVRTFTFGINATF